MAKQRRVLGSPLTPQRHPQSPIKPNLSTEKSPTPGSKQGPLSLESSVEPSENNGADDIICPICNENMVTVNQLNRHIDDIHIKGDSSTRPSSMSPLSTNSIGKLFNNEFIKNDIKKWFNTDAEPSKDDSDIEVTPSKRKTIKLDLFEGNQTFGLSDTNGNELQKSPTPLQKPRVSRAHWKRPGSSETICHAAGCSKALNVRNGIVNCRKCGELYCNEHTNYKARLENPKHGEIEPQYDVDGIWSRVCEKCYLNKPSVKLGTQVSVNNLTDSFKKVRAVKLEQNQLVADKVIKKFIRLVNLLAEVYYNEDKEPKGFFEMFQSSKTDEILIEQQKQIVGYENWQDDSIIHNCYICFAKFNFIIRKHHCRLCGRIVCDDSLGEREDCSLLVPIQLLVSKLSYLNYSMQVQKHFGEILKSKDAIFVTRICKVCKDDVLYDYKSKLVKTKQDHYDDKVEDIFKLYSQSLILKLRIKSQLPKYQEMVVSDTNMHQINVTKDKVMDNIKQFQGIVLEFKKKFFIQNEVNIAYKKQTKVIKTIHQGLILFLQQALLHLKEINNKLKDRENEQLPKRVEKPRLTKKQIRELRDSLMVMNEQKFLIENMIQDATKQRKFDELQTLNSSKEEITKEIVELETQLGEFGF